ncbi:MAG: hypothetical protein QOI57_3184 [Rubrobacteraceae bacterium]|nr:hypothetical protein [Rubrobacteraceae bacterium]
MASLTAAIKRPIEKLPWWVGPVTVTAVLTGFGIYVLITVFFFARGEYENYLSPFYSPPINSPLPAWLSPAILILWLPLGFRATCYYYRKAYYRAFFWDPPACSSKAQQREPRSTENYQGERSLFVWNNIHRYFLYGTFVVLAFLTLDTVRAFFHDGSFGIYVGSLIFLVNVAFLWTYQLSCHSLRHLIGGRVDCYSCVAGGKARLRAYSWLSVLNRQHGLWAWLSLFSLLITDVYIRLLLAGVLPDLRIL